MQQKAWPVVFPSPPFEPDDFGVLFPECVGASPQPSGSASASPAPSASASSSRVWAVQVASAKTVEAVCYEVQRAIGFGLANPGAAQRDGHHFLGLLMPFHSWSDAVAIMPEVQDAA